MCILDLVSRQTALADNQQDLLKKQANLVSVSSLLSLSRLSALPDIIAGGKGMSDCQRKTFQKSRAGTGLKYTNTLCLMLLNG